MGIKFRHREHNSRDILIRAKSTWASGMWLSVFLNDPALNCRNTIFIPCSLDSIRQACPIVWDEPDIQGSFEQYDCAASFSSTSLRSQFGSFITVPMKDRADIKGVFYSHARPGSFGYTYILLRRRFL
jgi:hypothetical protein